MHFLADLAAAFALRRKRNPRYSLRAFARDLGTDHSTLSQMLRGRRPISPRMIQRFGRKLQLPPAQLTDACSQQEAETVLQLVSQPGFRPHSRWIATRTGLSLDSVNAALHRLLYQGALVMESANRWKTKLKSKSHA